MEALWQDPTFWVAMAFCTFVVFAGKPIAKAIARQLDDRSARIDRELTEATRLRQEAQTLLDGYKARQQQAMGEAEEILRRAQDEAARITRTARDDLETLVEKRGVLVERRLAQMEAQAMQDLRAHTVDVAMAAARAIIREHLDPTRASALLQAALKDTERKLH